MSCTVIPADDACSPASRSAPEEESAPSAPWSRLPTVASALVDIALASAIGDGAPAARSVLHLAALHVRRRPLLTRPMGA